MTTGPRSLLAPLARAAARGSAPWHYQLLRSAEQALDDIARAGCAEVLLVRHPRLGAAGGFTEDLEERAQALGFVTAQVLVSSDCAFDTLEGFVQALGRAVRAPGGSRVRRGLLPLLDGFLAARPKARLADFDARVEAESLGGDLVSLGRAYLASPGRHEAARIEAWLSGVELSRAEPDAAPVLALSPRTAKRGFAEVTRLVRALGWRGTVVMVADADTIAKLPPARRDAAYTVLRELVDNCDGVRGLVSAQVVIAASTSFFTGPRSLASLRPLATRVESPPEAAAGVSPPHRPIVDLTPMDDPGRLRLPEVRPAPDAERERLSSVIRASHGLPPLDAKASFSVGHERIDRAIDQLFAHSAIDGSVFALLTGEYGAGKTHFLLHLAARALADRRPVLRLSVERLDFDLGHPERHLRRLLEQSTLPVGGGEGPLERLRRWTRGPGALDRLLDTLAAIAGSDEEAADAAGRALGLVEKTSNPAAALEAFLGAVELSSKTGSVGQRRDAYGRLLLWLSLLDRLEGCGGPVVLIDEAENLYRGAATRAERRTALRSLSFYCGGSIPRACVVLAITPEALEELRAEAPSLLEDVAEQRTVLACEDATMLCRRLARVRPTPVPALDRAQRDELARRVRETHEAVRGEVMDAAWASFVGRLVAEQATPREIVRRVTDRLECLWWAGGPEAERGAPAAAGRRGLARR